jgi:hypothetical protein
MSTTYSLISDLHESKQYRSASSMSSVSARILANHAFVDFIAMWVLSYDDTMRATVAKYILKTKSRGNFATYSQSGTDLFVALHYLSTKNKNLKDSELLDSINVNELVIKDFLNRLYMDTMTRSVYQTHIQRIERDFRIDDGLIKQARRNSQNFGTLSDSARANLIAWLYRFYMQNAPRSEMFGMIKQFAKTYNADVIAMDTANKPATEKPSGLAIAAVAAAGFAGGYYAGRQAASWLLDRND